MLLLTIYALVAAPQCTEHSAVCEEFLQKQQTSVRALLLRCQPATVETQNTLETQNKHRE